MNSTVCKPSQALFAPASESAFGPSRTIRDLILQTTGILFAWTERARQRRHLVELDDHLIKDIGLTRADVASEASKPFWVS